MERYFLNVNTLKLLIACLCFLMLIVLLLWLLLVEQSVFPEGVTGLHIENRNVNLGAANNKHFLDKANINIRFGAVDEILVEPVVNDKLALSNSASLFELFSVSMKEQLFEEDTSAIDMQLLRLMVGESDLALAVNGREAMEDYIVRKMHLSSPQEKYQWLLLLKGIGVTSAVTQQSLLKEIEAMTNAGLLGEALGLLEPVAGDHAEEVMNFLSLYVGHPNTTVSGIAIATLDLWSLSLQQKDF